MAIVYTLTQTDQELQQILELQRANLRDQLSFQELQSQGFVTLRHDLETLRLMHQEYPHVIAKYGDADAGNDKDRRVIGYALCMMKSSEKLIPTFAGVFQIIESVSYQGKILTNVPLSSCQRQQQKSHHEHQSKKVTTESTSPYFHYFVMGQVCVDKEFRGQGVVTKLYQHLRDTMAPHFQGTVTAISPRNPRSLRAHAKVGFQSLHDFTSKGEEWKLVILDWSNDSKDR